MKYRVKKTEEKYPYREIHNYGELSIEEIRKIALGLIGDVFDDEEEVDEDMKFIEEHGEENWSCNGYGIDISTGDRS